jgi:glycosyl transferase family 25
MVSLHFRIGDFKNLENHPIMPLEYYISAIKHIDYEDKNIKILYFCEDDDVDFVINNYINPLINIFPDIMFTQTKVKLEDWEQMVIMSLCKHHIIANSTFSWWSAYLAQDYINKIICYPDKWFQGALINNNTIDLFPEHWVMCDTYQNKYLLENVYYINLEERVDRKIFVETELTKMKWKYERFNAIKNDRGILGCGLSHLAVIEIAKEKNLDYVVIVEDDIQFLHPEKYNKMFIDFTNYVQSNNLDYDVLLIATNILDKVNGVIPINNYIHQVKASYSAAGYIVKKHYYDKIIANYREGLKLLIENPTVSGKYEFDVYWINLQLVDKWLVIYPRTVNQRESYSDILNCITDYTKYMIDQ